MLAKHLPGTLDTETMSTAELNRHVVCNWPFTNLNLIVVADLTEVSLDAVLGVYSFNLARILH